MKLKPLSDKVLLKIVEKNEHKVGDLVIHLPEGVNRDTNDFSKIYVEDLGPDVKGDLKKGDEVRTNSHIASVRFGDMMDFVLVSEQDIWAVVVK